MSINREDVQRERVSERLTYHHTSGTHTHTHTHSTRLNPPLPFTPMMLAGKSEQRG